MGLDWLETVDALGVDDRELSLLLGAGAIYPINAQINIIGEVNFRSNVDFIFLTGGVDYKFFRGDRLRGVLGIGLDDGAPDFSATVSYLLPF